MLKISLEKKFKKNCLKVLFKPCSFRMRFFNKFFCENKTKILLKSSTIQNFNHVTNQKMHPTFDRSTYS